MKERSQIKQDWQRFFSAASALLCAWSVAMSAYASHGLQGDSRQRMFMASYFAFAHGLSLIMLVRLSSARSNLWACSLMLSGLLMFSGSLSLAAIWHTSTALAPAGGMALIIAWCWTAVNFFRSGEK
ncbi:MAG: DUF423 domain-containing protein [Arenimonas sp.]